MVVTPTKKPRLKTVRPGSSTKTTPVKGQGGKKAKLSSLPSPAKTISLLDAFERKKESPQVSIHRELQRDIDADSRDIDTADHGIHHNRAPPSAMADHVIDLSSPPDAGTAKSVATTLNFSTVTATASTSAPSTSTIAGAVGAGPMGGRPLITCPVDPPLIGSLQHRVLQEKPRLAAAGASIVNSLGAVPMSRAVAIEALREATLDMNARASPADAGPSKQKMPVKKTTTPGKAAKALEAEQRRLEREQAKAQREAERLREKAKRDAEKAKREAEKAKRDEEKAKRDEEKAKRDAEKEVLRKKREAERKEKEEERERARVKREEEKAKLQAVKDAKDKLEEDKKKKKKKHSSAFKSFFNAQPTKKPKVVEDVEGKERTEFQKYFSPFFLAAHTRLAPVSYITRDERAARMARVDEVLQQQDAADTSAVTAAGESVASVVHQMRRDHDGVRPSLTLRGQPRLKFFTFAYQRRPQFYGSFQKKSHLLKARAPFNKDTTLFDYDVDSDDEWEDEPEGEDCSDVDGDDDEKMGGESGDDDEDLTSFLVPHGYLSDDEVQDGDGDGEQDVDMGEDGQEAAAAGSVLRRKRLQEKENHARQARPVQRLVPTVVGVCYDDDDEHLHPEYKDLRDSHAAIACDHESLPITCTAASTEQESETPKKTSTRGCQKSSLEQWMIVELREFVRVNQGGITKLVQGFVQQVSAKVSEMNAVKKEGDNNKNVAVVPTKAAVERWIRENRATCTTTTTTDDAGMVGGGHVTPVKVSGSKQSLDNTPTAVHSTSVKKNGSNKKHFKTVTGQRSLLDALNRTPKDSAKTEPVRKTVPSLPTGGVAPSSTAAAVTPFATTVPLLPAGGAAPSSTAAEDAAMVDVLDVDGK